MKQVQHAVTDFAKANNTTKEELALKLGFKHTSFYNKLCGKSEYTLSEAYSLSRELGCTLDDFYSMTVTEL